MKDLGPDETRKRNGSGYDRDLPQARADSERGEAADNLRQKIECAFAGVTLGNGIGLKEARGLDDYEGAEVLAQLHAQDERLDWHRFTSDDLLTCQTSISFTDAAGMRFHLPALMLAELRNEGIEGLIWSLCRIAPHNEVQFDLLSSEQRAAVRDFLGFMRDDPGYTDQRAEIDAAIERIWSFVATLPNPGGEPGVGGQPATRLESK